MPENPGDAQGNTSVAQGGGAAATPPPGAPPDKNGQPSTIKVGDKEFRAEDVQGIMSAKAGLEDANRELKKKLDAYETEKLSAQEKLEKEKRELAEENAKLRQSVINGKIARALEAAGVAIKAELLNIQVTDESQIETAVQNLIKENPMLVNRASGQQQAPPGAAPPASPPPGGDVEKELEQAFSRATTLKEYKELEARLYALRGQKPPEGRKPI